MCTMLICCGTSRSLLTSNSSASILPGSGANGSFNASRALPRKNLGLGFQRKSNVARGAKLAGAPKWCDEFFCGNVGCRGNRLRTICALRPNDSGLSTNRVPDAQFFKVLLGASVAARVVLAFGSQHSREPKAGENFKQNEELPPLWAAKRTKKPFVRPIKHGSHAKRMKRRALKQLPPKPLKAPANGLLVKRLIPVAHRTYDAYRVVLDGVSRLLKHLPLKACRWCSEIHVGRVGHEIKTCQGKGSTGRGAGHLWVPGYLDDVVVPTEAFHLVDRLQKPIKHEDRFKYERIPAIVELCIQAGLDLPEFPTLRRTTPIDSPVGWQNAFGDEEHATFSEDDGRSKELDNAGSSDDETKTLVSGGGEDEYMVDEENERTSLTNEAGEGADIDDPDDLEGSSQTQSVSEVDDLSINDDDDLKTVAEKTLRAWGTLRYGADQLMKTYAVRACGYCPEVHIGRRGHKLQLCGAFKHQWRNGQHGWQDAALDDLIPLRYVWHLRDVDGPPLVHKLAKYYGKAPAIVELCVQAGADIPAKHRPRMRLDVIIPDVDELEMVS